MINMALAKHRGLSKSQIKDLETLHRMMRRLNVYWVMFGGERWDKSSRKQFRKDVRRIEYLMQDAWGFDRDKSRHTHYERLAGLCE